MNKVTLKLHEFYNLEAELNGVINQQTGEVVAKGLLSEKIKLTTKYWLSDLVKKVSAEKQAVEALKEELIKKHGEQDENGSVSIPMYIDKVDENGNAVTTKVKKEDGQEEEVPVKLYNPKFIDFQNDFNALLQEERELEHKPFKLDEFENVESDGVYTTFFKLVEVGD
jgi:hypothetical protein